MSRNSKTSNGRRKFLAATAASGAGLLTGALSSMFPRNVAAAERNDPIWIEKSIPDLQRLMASGALTSRELTLGYLQRIGQYNPLVHAVIETNPMAVAIAAKLDNERRQGRPLRGPLHGIPVLVKDNIATDDNMETTAGSLALVHSKVREDAVVTDRLRAAGAVILGKANLGEWANFRGFNPLGFYGWSARGGPTRNPYLLDYIAMGSSSGSAVSVVTNMCAASVGTETDGSIVNPSNAYMAVGLKPTLGLISQSGIIPISHNQDTAGPIGRTVTDIAVMLGVLQSPFGAVEGQPLPPDYTQFLKRGALKGARIGVDQRYFDQYDFYGFPGDGDTLPYVQQALDAMVAAGSDACADGYRGLRCVLRRRVHGSPVRVQGSHRRVPRGTRGTPKCARWPISSQFNLAHCQAEMPFYGQELFELAEATSGDLTDPAYLAARSAANNAARSGIDNALAANDLDAIVAPHMANASTAAVAGYPNLALPVGITPAGKPPVC